MRIIAKPAVEFPKIIGLLICTLISENPGLEKSRSVSNLRKNSDPANLGLYYKSEKNSGDKLRKKSRFAGPEICVRL